jgi:hypothetical protein
MQLARSAFGIDETITRTLLGAWEQGRHLTLTELAARARYSTDTVRARLKDVSRQLLEAGICASLSDTPSGINGATTINLSNPPCPLPTGGVRRARVAL